jgi:hypothetical protein
MDHPFVIKFESNQDPNFVALNSKLKGFYLIDAKYLSQKGKICEMKLLQIVTREKSEDEIREGTANAVDCSAVVLGMSKSTATKSTFTRFSSLHHSPSPCQTMCPVTRSKPHLSHSNNSNNRL